MLPNVAEVVVAVVNKGSRTENKKPRSNVFRQCREGAGIKAEGRNNKYIKQSDVLYAYKRGLGSGCLFHGVRVLYLW